MKIDIIFYKHENFSTEKLDKIYHLSKLKESVLELTSRKPEIHFDINNIEKGCYYFLFCLGAEEYKNEFNKISSQMILMTSHWSDLETLANEFQFIGTVILTHYLNGFDALLGQKGVVEKMDVIIVEDYSGKSQVIGSKPELQYLFVNGRKKTGLIELLIDYLEHFEKFKGHNKN
jgi:hypothetical protein